MKPKTALNETAAHAQRLRPLVFLFFCLSTVSWKSVATKLQVIFNTKYFSCSNAYEHLFVKFESHTYLPKVCFNLKISTKFREIM